jgi:hypothetical protein
MFNPTYKSKTVDIPGILTMSIVVKKFPEDVKDAFNSLEQKLSSKNGRQFLGAINVSNTNIEYKACLVQKAKNEHVTLGFDSYVIPGGKYITNKLVNWTKNTHLIKEMFEEMGYKFRFDANRPQLEYYKSNRELILMLPIIPREEQLSLAI